MTTAAIQPARPRGIRLARRLGPGRRLRDPGDSDGGRSRHPVLVREAGAHGPIILATGAWLIWRRAAAASRRSADPEIRLLTFALLVPALVLYVFGRAYDFLTFEAAGLYVVVWP